MNNIRFGIIGAGGIASKFCDAVRRVEGAEVCAVASKSEERAQAFAEKNGVPQAYGSYEAMLKEAGVDAVYIATTHNFHMDNLRLCFAYGKHVLCEKAMVLTADDAREAFRLAEEKGVFCMEAMWSNFLPSVQKAKEWITSGAIGTLQSVSAVIGFNGGGNPESRLFNPSLAGGAMYDIGVYPAEIVSYLVGEPIRDCVGLWRPHPLTGVDERASFLLRYDSCDAAIQCLLTSNAREYTILNGSDGCVELPFGSSGFLAKRYDSRRQLAETFEGTFENGFVFEIEEMLRCIRAGRLTSEIMPPEATIQCAEIYDKVLRGKSK
ncbi:MAG: Gfo/Idh/MocA family protein [Eubacteriales bacterium]